MKFIADDWGLSREINDAILDLAKYRVISRVSIMPRSSCAKHRIDELKNLRIETSLHFDLTSFARAPSLWSVARGVLTDIEIDKALEDQVLLYRNLGFNLNAIEGHQYIHLLPQVARRLRAFAIKSNFSSIAVRRMIDWRHPIAFVASIRAFHFDFKDSVFTPFDVTEFRPIIRAPRPMVIHPATKDSGDWSDAWRFRRVSEYKTLLSLISSQQNEPAGAHA